MKARILAFPLAILLFGVGVGFTHYFLAPDPSFVKVPPQEKEFLNTALACGLNFPGMPGLAYNVLYSDLIVKATILSKDYVNQYGRIVDEGEGQPQFTLQVEHLIFGNVFGKLDSEIMQWREVPSPILPQPGDTVILFLQKRYHGFYSIRLEDGIFTVDEKGRLYSLSRTEELSAFDGANWHLLRDAVWRELGRNRQEKRDYDARRLQDSMEKASNE